jgi:hypothetical protein
LWRVYSGGVPETYTMTAEKFAVKKRRSDEWLIFQPGGRLDVWGPDVERAEYLTLADALAARRLRLAERYADVVRIPADVNDPTDHSHRAQDLETYDVVAPAEPDKPYHEWKRGK